MIYIIGLIAVYALLVYLRQRFGERDTSDILLDDFIRLKNWGKTVLDEGKKEQEARENRFARYQEEAARRTTDELRNEIKRLKKIKENTGLTTNQSMRGRAYIDEYNSRKN